MEHQCNLNAHFHFILDSYINHYELRQLWNRLQNKLGYVDRYRSSMLSLYKSGFTPSINVSDTRSIAQQTKAYELGVKTDWAQPNSTDIHSVYNITNIAAYLGKYFSKNNIGAHLQIKRGVFGIKKKFKRGCKSVSVGALKFLRRLSQIGRIWGCSVDLSKLKGLNKEIDSEVSYVLDKLIACKDGVRFDKDFFSIYFFDTSILNKKDYKILFNWLFAYIIDTIGYFSSE
jgi:hypothetical protein